MILGGGEGLLGAAEVEEDPPGVAQPSKGAGLGGLDRARPVAPPVEMTGDREGDLEAGPGALGILEDLLARVEEEQLEETPAVEAGVVPGEEGAALGGRFEQLAEQQPGLRPLAGQPGAPFLGLDPAVGEHPLEQTAVFCFRGAGGGGFAGLVQGGEEGEQALLAGGAGEEVALDLTALLLRHVVAEESFELIAVGMPLVHRLASPSSQGTGARSRAPVPL